MAVEEGGTPVDISIYYKSLTYNHKASATYGNYIQDKSSECNKHSILTIFLIKFCFCFFKLCSHILDKNKF